MEDERAEVGLSSIKQLAYCNKTSRDKALSFLLDSWLPTQTHVSDDLMKKLWKGLFYCVWHADKIPAQAELADSLSSLVPKLDLPLSLHFLSVFFLTMRREWTGIDALRLDKFYLLIRRFLHNFFVLLKRNSWDLELSRRLMGVFEERTFLADDKFQGNGVNYHIAAIFLQELRPFLPIRLEVVDVLFKPFLTVMPKFPDKVLLGKIRSNMFDELLKKGKELLEVKKSGEDVDSSSDVLLLGSIALTMGFSGKFYELGSSPDCCQGNRKFLFSLHEEFSKLEKDLASSGIDVSIPDVIEHSEEELPNLIPITSEEMEVSASEYVEVMQGANLSLKKCGKGKASGGGEESSKKSKKKKKKKKKKNESTDSDCEKGSTVTGNENEADANGDELVSDQISGEDLVVNESVISNLQLQFEKIAAEAGLDNDLSSSCDVPKSTKSSTVSRKRKRARAMDGKQSQNSLQNGEEDSIGPTTAKSGEKNAKKVKFSMKNNLIWKPHNPLPPESLRLPPSVTPRGSALKKGVPPGPIRELPSPAKKVKLRAVSVKKARKGVKRLKKIKSLSA